MKILIIRFSSIGDIVLTTPVIRCLKKQSQAEVHYITKKAYKSILEANPYIDKIWTIDKKVGEVIKQLKTEGFDYIIDLHKNLRSWQIKNALKAQSFSFDKINWEKWLMVNLKINKLPEVHIVERYMQTLSPLGISYDGEGLDYFIPQSQYLNPRNFIQKHAPQLYRKRRFDYIAFVIGAAHQTKRLPTKKIIEFCKQSPLPIVLLGGKGEAEEGEKITKEVGYKVVNGCGKMNLHQSASLVAQAQKVVTHDTGMMHIAAAFQKEIISVWGNTIPEFGMYPFYKKGVDRNTTIEVKNLGCRPCSKIGYAKCPKGHHNCMNNIDKIF